MRCWCAVVWWVVSKSRGGIFRFVFRGMESCFFLVSISMFPTIAATSKQKAKSYTSLNRNTFSVIPRSSSTSLHIVVLYIPQTPSTNPGVSSKYQWSNFQQGHYHLSRTCNTSTPHSPQILQTSQHFPFPPFSVVTWPVAVIPSPSSFHPVRISAQTKVHNNSHLSSSFWMGGLVPLGCIQSAHLSGWKSFVWGCSGPFLDVSFGLE